MFKRDNERIIRDFKRKEVDIIAFRDEIIEWDVFTYRNAIADVNQT